MNPETALTNRHGSNGRQDCKIYKILIQRNNETHHFYQRNPVNLAILSPNPLFSHLCLLDDELLSGAERVLSTKMQLQLTFHEIPVACRLSGVCSCRNSFDPGVHQ
jgi:hypothetical protein